MELPKNSIRNPLTIIGAFAAIAEVSGTTVLAFLPLELQRVFIWFAMGFPLLLVVLFFGVLYFRHQVLYAPSDFKSDETFSRFIRDIRPLTPEEAKQRRTDEIENAEIVAESPQSSTEQSSPVLERSSRADSFLAEELALKALEQKYGSTFQRQKSFKLDGKRYSADGLIDSTMELSFFEIKYVRSLQGVLQAARSAYQWFDDLNRHLPEDDRSDYTAFFLVVVTPIPKSDQLQLEHRIKKYLADKPFSVNLIVFDLNELKDQYGLT